MLNMVSELCLNIIFLTLDLNRSNITHFAGGVTFALFHFLSCAVFLNKLYNAKKWLDTLNSYVIGYQFNSAQSNCNKTS